MRAKPGQPNRSQWRGRAVLLAAAMALAACQATTQSAGLRYNGPPPLPSTQPLVPPSVDLARLSSDHLAPTADRTPDAATTPPPEIDDDPSQVVGLFGPEVAILLGAPVIVRREIGAEIWQYRRADCIFDLFLYHENGEPSPRVTYFELRTIQTRGALSERDGRSCFGGIVLDAINGAA